VSRRKGSRHPFDWGVILRKKVRILAWGEQQLPKTEDGGKNSEKIFDLRYHQAAKRKGVHPRWSRQANAYSHKGERRGRNKMENVLGLKDSVMREREKKKRGSVAAD